jgi:hypothetical protein
VFATACDRFGSAGSSLDAIACSIQRRGEDLAVLRVIFDYEHTTCSDARQRRRASHHGDFSDARIDRKHGMKHAALAGRRANADRATLRLDEPARQREPQARALVTLGRAAIELLEFHEQPA